MLEHMRGGGGGGVRSAVWLAGRPVVGRARVGGGGRLRPGPQRTSQRVAWPGRGDAGSAPAMSSKGCSSGSGAR